uniref:Uncharacterized protein n=1 Tax=Glossina austeni TaxID=7395 RepID=A0A1A9UVX0_GLOAU
MKFCKPSSSSSFCDDRREEGENEIICLLLLSSCCSCSATTTATTTNTTTTTTTTTTTNTADNISKRCGYKFNRTLQHLRIYNKSGLHYHTTTTITTTTTTITTTITITTTTTATFGNINISHFKYNESLTLKDCKRGVEGEGGARKRENEKEREREAMQELVFGDVILFNVAIVVDVHDVAVAASDDADDETRPISSFPNIQLLQRKLGHRNKLSFIGKSRENECLLFDISLQIKQLSHRLQQSTA